MDPSPAALQARIRQLQEQNQLLHTVLNHLDALVYMKDRQRRYLYANIHSARLFGQSQQSIVGKTDAEMLTQAEADRLGILDQQVLGLGHKSMGEENFVDAQGVTRHYWSVKMPLESYAGPSTEGLHADSADSADNPDNAVDAYVGMSTDITEVVRLKEKFRNLANTDSLTGILSRRYLLERAEQELRRARRAGSHLAVIAFDIDKFKTINDSHGHAMGDRAIVQVVDACLQNLRETDLFGRLGGDEFVVVAVDTDLLGALAVAERMRESVFAAVLRADSGQPVRLSASFGLAMSDMDASLDVLLSRADSMLYEAKQSGRNQVRHTAPPEGSSYLDSLKML